MPLGYAAVAVTPDGVLPFVGVLVLFQNQLLVDLHTQAGLHRQGDPAVHKLEILLIVNIVQNALAHIFSRAAAPTSLGRSPPIQL